MKWLQNLIFFFGAILIYLHIFIHFKISELNEFTTINEISKEKILSSIYYKLPFVFDGTTIIKPVDLISLKEKKKKEKENKNDKENDKEKRIYKNTYQPLPLLEPFVRFFTNNTIYELKKNKKIGLHQNLECRNFYMLHSGKVIIHCIHPKYKYLIKDTDIDPDIDLNKLIEIKEVLQVELYPNSILFVPNYWYVYVKSIEKSVVEKVQYKTILNEINFLHNKMCNSICKSK